MRNLICLLLLAAVAWSWPIVPVHAMSTYQDGYWYCLANGVTPPQPNSCAFASGTGPDPTDVADIYNNVTLWGQSSNPPSPLEVDVTGVNLHPGITLGIYEGRTIVTSGASVWSGGNLDHCCNGGGSFDNEGTLQVTESMLINGGWLYNSGLMQLAPGVMLTRHSSALLANQAGAPAGVFELQDTAIYADYGTSNAGIVRKTGAGTATYSALLVDAPYPDDGTAASTIEVDAGELKFTPVPCDQYNNLCPSGIDGSQNYQIAPGATLRLANGSVSNFAYNQGVLMTQTGTGGGAFILDTGAVVNAAGGPADSAVLDFAPGMFQWWGGTLANGGFRNDGEITLHGVDPKVLSGGNFRNAGSFNIPAGETLTAYANWFNLPGGTLALGDGATLTDTYNVTNSGLVLKNDGTGTAIFSAPLVDASYPGGGPAQGTIEVDSGELELMPVPCDQYNNLCGSGIYGSQNYQIAAGATLRFGNGSVSQFAYDSVSVSVHSGSGGGSFIVDAGAALYAGGGNTDNAILDFPAGMFVWQGGYLGGSGWRNNGVITVAGSAQKILGGLMRNAGTLAISSGEQLDLNSLLINLPGGTVTLDDGSVINDNFNGGIVNQGLVIKAQGAGTALLNNSNYSGNGSTGLNTGVLEVDSGTIEDRTNSDFYGTMRAASGTSILRTQDTMGTPNSLNLYGNALLTGSGTLSASYINVAGGASIEPAGAATIGTLTLESDLKLTQGSAVFDIAGSSQYDQLYVSGNMDASGAFAPHGSITARFLGGYAPVMGQHFPLIHLGGAVTDPLDYFHVQYVNLAFGFQAHLEFNAATHFVELVADSTGTYLPDAIFHGDFE